MKIKLEGLLKIQYWILSIVCLVFISSCYKADPTFTINSLNSLVKNKNLLIKKPEDFIGKKLTIDLSKNENIKMISGKLVTPPDAEVFNAKESEKYIVNIFEYNNYMFLLLTKKIDKIKFVFDIVLMEKESENHKFTSDPIEYNKSVYWDSFSEIKRDINKISSSEIISVYELDFSNNKFTKKDYNNAKLVSEE